MPRYIFTVPLRPIALLTILAFGCATVRVPASSPSQPADAPGTVAPPITELWIESSEEVPPALSEKMDAQARAALAEALEAWEIPSHAAGAEDAVLFVRERAVATTEARNKEQTWAKVGIAVGVVLVIAAIVVIAVALAGTGGSRGSSHPTSARSGSSPAKAAAPPVAVKPRAVPPPRVVPPAGPVPLPPPPIPYAYRPYPSFFIGFNFNFVIPLHPWSSAQPPVPFAPEPPDDSAPPPPPDEEPAAAVALQLPPLAEAMTFPVEDRTFFAGPLTALQLDLVDRATGQLLWSKAVKADEDPLDPRAVGKVLDQAFAGIGWARP